MADIQALNLENKTTRIGAEAFESFTKGIRGTVVLKGDPDYDQHRALWNGMIDRRPAAIIRCSGTADVARSVLFAREHNLLVSVRGNGHNIAGKAAADEAFMIDLSPMRWVHVDPDANTAWVGAGATLGDMDHETQAFSLATPVGINSTTGISGLTLGGGFGWLSRAHGLAIDNLLSAEVVTADGRIVTASEKENPDLFWAIRGGGGNFGIVSSFQFRLHPVGPEVLSGLIVHPFSEAKSVLREYRKFVSNAPDELTCWVVLRKAPPLPFLPEAIHGKEIVILPLLYSGDIRAGEKALQPLRKFGNPIADVVGVNPYTGFQTSFDPLLTPGARNYWKSHNFADLSDEAIEIMIRYAGDLPTPMSEIFIAHLGGAVNRVPANKTAYPHRDVEFILNVHTRWEEAGDDAKCIEWARRFSDDTAPFASGSVYVNFISEGEERVPAAFGGNYDRLVRVKQKYDPENFFRINQNIRP